MTDKQRIKLVRLLRKMNDPIIRVLDRFDFAKNKLDPICYELQYEPVYNGVVEKTKVYIGVVFGEILRFELGNELWDSAMRKGEACPEDIKSIIDNYLIARAEYQSRLCKQEILLKVGTDPLTTATTDKQIKIRMEVEALIQEIVGNEMLRKDKGEPDD